MKWKISNKQPMTEGYKLHIKIGERGNTSPILLAYRGQDVVRATFSLYYNDLSSCPDDLLSLKDDDPVTVTLSCLGEDEIMFEGPLKKAIKWGKSKPRKQNAVRSKNKA